MSGESVEEARKAIEPVRCPRCAGVGFVESFDYDVGNSRRLCYVCEGACTVPNIAPVAVTHIRALIAEVEKLQADCLFANNLAVISGSARQDAESERDAARAEVKRLQKDLQGKVAIIAEFSGGRPSGPDHDCG